MDTTVLFVQSDCRRVAPLQNGSVVKQYYYDAAGNMIKLADSVENRLGAGGRKVSGTFF